MKVRRFQSELSGRIWIGRNFSTNAQIILYPSTSSLSAARVVSLWVRQGRLVCDCNLYVASNYYFHFQNIDFIWWLCCWQGCNNTLFLVWDRRKSITTRFHRLIKGACASICRIDLNEREVSDAKQTATFLSILLFGKFWSDHLKKYSMFVYF